MTITIYNVPIPYGKAAPKGWRRIAGPYAVATEADMLAAAIRDQASAGEEWAIAGSASQVSLYIERKAPPPVVAKTAKETWQQQAAARKTGRVYSVAGINGRRK
jgi:hypothetical protein